MKKYLSYDQLTLSDLSENSITQKYNEGYVFTRIGKGVMYKTRSLRINLNNFEFNSENRRVLNKNSNLVLKYADLPIPLDKYDWKIHSLGSKYYSTKFGKDVFSASKIKELFTNISTSNFNLSFIYLLNNILRVNPFNETMLGTDYNTVIHNMNEDIKDPIGYCLCYMNSSILHYSYPFYDLTITKDQNLGMGMMLKAIDYSLKNNLEYIYLGSVSTLESKYKLQFNNLEWFDIKTNSWNTDINLLKQTIDDSSSEGDIDN